MVVNTFLPWHIPATWILPRILLDNKELPGVQTLAYLQSFIRVNLTAEAGGR